MSLFTDNRNTAVSIIGAASTLSIAYGLYHFFGKAKNEPEVPIPKPCFPYFGKLSLLYNFGVFVCHY
jgi:hypothetical protein